MILLLLVPASNPRVWLWLATSVACGFGFYLSWMKLAGFVWDWDLGWCWPDD